MDLRIKRVYAAASPEDGRRVLVDRLWPRGVSRESAAIDVWLRDIAPSDELRRWFGHDPARWDGFVERYAQELEESREAVAEIERLMAAGPVTLVYSARDETHNQAVALQAFLGRGLA